METRKPEPLTFDNASRDHSKYSCMAAFVAAQDLLEDPPMAQATRWMEGLLDKFEDAYQDYKSGQLAVFDGPEQGPFGTPGKRINVFVRKDGDIFVDFDGGTIFKVPSFKVEEWPEDAQQGLLAMWNGI